MVTLSEWESKRVLGDVPRPPEVLARTAQEAVAFARSVGGPVVAKASGLAHKTERRGVRTNLSPESMAAAFGELAALGDGAVLVAEQVAADYELIVGGVRDPQFGPVVSIGLGGVAAELLRDVTFVLAPPRPGELDRALAGLRCAPLLDGWRGRPPVERSELMRIVAAISRLMEEDEGVIEVDCNPVMVSGGRPLVVDALVVRR